jgi:hypothetical protein
MELNVFRSARFSLPLANERLHSCFNNFQGLPLKAAQIGVICVRACKGCCQKIIIINNLS